MQFLNLNLHIHTCMFLKRLSKFHLNHFQDGEICDMSDTVDRIVAASRLPLSIVIVGVGGANFKNMVSSLHPARSITIESFCTMFVFVFPLLTNYYSLLHIEIIMYMYMCRCILKIAMLMKYVCLFEHHFTGNTRC